MVIPGYTTDEIVVVEGSYLLDLVVVKRPEVSCVPESYCQ